VTINVYSEGFEKATVRAWLPSAGNAAVDFGEGITTLDEDDLIGLLKVCRKARKMYAAANKLNNE
jgi:hypothetical protein